MCGNEFLPFLSLQQFPIPVLCADHREKGQEAKKGQKFTKNQFGL